MSRTYNTPPSGLRTKMAELGRGLGDAAKALFVSPWMALKMGFESVLRAGRPERSVADRTQQFFGLGSITQDLLDQAERDRRRRVPADPFETLAGRSAALRNDVRPASQRPFKKSHAVRRAER